jgi:hypothetical protein
MKGDFSRRTYHRTKHFSGVLMQQGRVQLDADWNDQRAIEQYRLQTLARDLFGPHGGPASGLGFAITVDASQTYNFKIGAGRYYVGGILCENDADCWYVTAEGGAGKDPLPGQPDYTPAAIERLEKLAQDNHDESFLAYLDVWERHITYVEDDSIREVALGGPDTATRAKVVWQVKLMRAATGADGATPACDEVTATLPGLGAAQLKARVKPTQPSTDPCIQAPDARYRGAENQLYRVEIHEGGSGSAGVAGAGATFKWSRDNGAIIFPIIELNGAVATLMHLGRDARLGLQVGDWVEVIDDDVTLHGDPGPMLQVDAIDPVEMQVTLKTPANIALPVYAPDSARHPYLRRWDQKGAKGAPLVNGAVRISEDQGENGWLNLEDGVQVQFQPGGVYRSGDYWLIPARVATGRIEWPGPIDAPLASAPHGVEHAYAPLAMLTVDASGKVQTGGDCRCALVLQRQCLPPGEGKA